MLSIGQRTGKGEDHPRAKLTTKDVINIRQRIEAGAKYRELCIEYDVDETTIRAIVKRRSWKHI